MSDTELVKKKHELAAKEKVGRSERGSPGHRGRRALAGLEFVLVPVALPFSLGGLESKAQIGVLFGPRRRQ